MVVTIGERHLDIEPGSIGVIVEHIEESNGCAGGITALFENGTFDDFSEVDTELYDLVPHHVEVSLAHYLFKDPLSLTFDFVQGAFDSAFKR
jgi:hypothetical protein